MLVVRDWRMRQVAGPGSRSQQLGFAPSQSRHSQCAILSRARHINCPQSSEPSSCRHFPPWTCDRLMAHYSSLFTLGLLSDRASPPSSPKLNFFYKFRKSSLPTRSISKPFSESYAAPPSESLHLPSPQFTNPFAANSSVSEPSTELRSFLSLDLAADKALNPKLLSPLDISVSPTAPLHSTNIPPYVIV